jgi:hypothetical protein
MAAPGPPMHVCMIDRETKDPGIQPPGARRSLSHHLHDRPVMISVPIKGGVSLQLIAQQQTQQRPIISIARAS